MALRFAMILEAVDRMSGPGRRALGGVRGLNRGTRELGRSGAQSGRMLDRLSAAAGRMRARMGAALTRVRALAGRAGLKALDLAARGTGFAIGKLIRLTGSLAVGALQAGTAFASLAASATFGNVFRIGRSFEDLEVRLAGVAGSTDKAKQELRSLFDLKLPVPIEQLAESYVKLRELGIDPSRQSLSALIGEALRTKKPVEELVETLMAARNGDFDGLESLGIKATTKGARTTFQYLDRDGRRVLKRVADDSRQVEQALLGIFGDRSQDMMDRYGRSLAGIGVQLTNWWNRFSLKIADAGIYDMFKAKLQNVLDWLDARLNDGSLEEWAKSVSTHMETAIKWVERLIKNTDWQKFAGDLSAAAEGFIAIGKAAAWAASKIAENISANDRMLAWREARSAQQIENSWGYSDAQKKVAREGRQALEREHGPLTDAGRKEVEQRANTMPIGMWKGRDGKRQTGTSTVRPTSRAAPMNLRGTPIGAKSPAAPQKVAVGGKMEIELKAPPGWTATPTRMSSVNPAVPAVFRGKANAGWG